MEKSAAGADASLNLAGPDDVYFSFAPRANGAAGQAKAQAFTPTELGRIQPRQTLPKATAKAGHDDDDRENAYETDNSDDSDLDFDHIVFDSDTSTESVKRRIFAGDLSVLNVWEETKRTVRVFVSSTFSDTKSERDSLLKNVVPSIREYARGRGLEFQFLDLRWGIRDQAEDNHEIVDLCLQQLRACQVLSPRLNFVSLLGHKYGYRPIPTRIDKVEFEVILEAATTQDRQLLEKWYKQDTNMVPPAYRLLPISTHIPHFTVRELAVQHKAAQAEWYAHPHPC